MEISEALSSTSIPAEHFASFLDALPVGMVALGPDGTVLYTNPFARDALGARLTAATAIEKIPEAWEARRPDTDVPYPADEFPAVLALRGQESRIDDVELGTDAGRLPYVIWATPLLDESGALRHVLIAFRDVSRRRKMEERLRKMALSDSLTGLPNRVLLMDRLRHGLARLERAGSGLALMFVDLDEFKRVNDTLGHAAGDELLIEVARRIRETLRRHDTAARIGGDEFIVVCEDVQDHATAFTLAERLRDKLADPYALKKGTLSVTASIGVARTDTQDADPEMLLQAADADMYRVKRRNAARH